MRRDRRHFSFKVLFFFVLICIARASGQVNLTGQNNTLLCNESPFAPDEFSPMVRGNGRLENRIMLTANQWLENNRVVPCFANNVSAFLKRRLSFDRLFLESGETLLLTDSGFSPSIRKYYAQHTHANVWTSGGEPLLHTVARAHDSTSVRFLLQQRVPIDQIDLRWERTALLATAETGAVRTAAVLIQHGANINATDILGRNLADIAAHNGQHEFISELVESGVLRYAIPHSVAGQVDWFQEGRIQGVIDALVSFSNRLLFHKVDTYLKDLPAARFIASIWAMVAISTNRVDLLQHLLTHHHANPHLVLDNQGAAFTYAITQNKIEAAIALANAGALNHFDASEKKTCLQYLSEYLRKPHREEVLRRLRWLQAALTTHSVFTYFNAAPAVPLPIPEDARNAFPLFEVLFFLVLLPALFLFLRKQMQEEPEARQAFRAGF